MIHQFAPTIRVIDEAYDIPELGRTRRISALLPHNYDTTDTHYPVLYLHDGQNLFNKDAPYGNWGIDQSLAKLAESGWGDLIIIAVDHGDEERIMEYSPYDNKRFGKGQGEAYLQFLMNTLKPYVDRHFRVLTGREHTGIGGSSMGGLISLYAGMRYKHVFGKMMIFSPSLWIAEEVFQEAEAFVPDPDTRIYVYAGERESVNHIPNVLRLRSCLQTRVADHAGFRLEVAINPEGTHSEVYWGKAFPHALKWLFFQQKQRLSMKVEVQSWLSRETSAIVLPYFEDQIDWVHIRNISGINLKGDFSGKFAEVLPLYAPDRELKVFLLGLGKERDKPRMAQAFRSLGHHHQQKWDQSLVLDLRHLSADAVLEAALGLRLAAYRPDMFKTVEASRLPLSSDSFGLTFIHQNDQAEAKAHDGILIAETQLQMMRLVDSPANRMTPEDLASYAVQSGQQYGFRVEVLDREALEREGLHALLAVGKGSQHPPVCIKLVYCPSHLAGTTPQVGLVGKGITFDTGGISIKPSTNLHYMKCDMGGAAAVLGAVELAAKLSLGIHLVGIIPAAENSVDALSVRPSDVIDSYAGKSIEVIDTDAEGRLILADGLAYLQSKYQPEVMIDLATLTGSVVQTLGYAASGLFTANDMLAEKLIRAGAQVHERTWRLPLWEDYEVDLHSDVADLRNFSGKPVAGAITAAKFLEAFTKEHPLWAHLDIAGVAFGDSEFTKMKSATGYGIRLLTAFMMDHIAKKA